MKKDSSVYLLMSMFRPYTDCENVDIIYHNDNAICCYIALRILYNENPYHILEFTIKDLLHALGFNKERLERQAKKIKQGLEFLNEYGFISYEKKGNTYIIRNVTNIHIDTRGCDGFWFKIPLENIYKLTKYSNAFTLIHVYATLVSTINIKNHIGCTSQIRIVKYIYDCVDDADAENKRCNIVKYYKIFITEGIIYFSKQLALNKPKLYALDKKYIDNFLKKALTFD